VVEGTISDCGEQMEKMKVAISALKKREEELEAAMEVKEKMDQLKK
jgi:hypothetical protein